MFKKVGSLIFFITLSLFVFAQQSNIKFDRINYKDGLSQSDVTSIIQDYKGLIWMGTQDGLNLYNGFEFTVFSHDLLDSTSISNNFVHVLFEDSDSNLWIGTENGLNLFNRAKQNFRHFLKGTTSKNTKKLNVWSITEDENKNVWVGTDSKLFKLTKNTTTPSNYSISKINLPLSTKINDLLIRKLLFINADELLIATESNGLFLYNPTTKVLEQFTTENSKLKSNIIWDIHKDSQGFIGIATNNGINILNTQTKTIVSVKELDNVIGNKIIKALYEDKSGIIWAGTENDGLYKLKSLSNADHYLYSATISTSLSSNKINIILEDRSGIIWIGTQAGINKFDKQKQFFKHYQHWPDLPNTINSNMVWSIFQDKSENLYIGTNQGITIFENSNNIVSYLKPDFTKENNLKNEGVYSIYQDSKGRIYTGTDGGVFELKNKVFLPLSCNEKNTSRTYTIIEDSKNRLWAGTKYGILIFSEDRKNCESITTKKNVGTNLPSNVIRVIHESKNGVIWLGTDGGGLCKVSENENGFSLKIYQRDERSLNSLNNNSVLTIYEDKAGIFWIGTFGGGLNKFNPKTEQFDYFTEKEGLSNNVIYGILSDNKDNLWMSTNKGVSCFDTKKNFFRNFEDSDGLQSNEFNTGAFFKNKYGELFFGGINGFNSFFPEDVKRNTSLPIPYITNFYLFNKPVQIGSNSILTKHISELDELILKHKQNVISFEFASLHYSFPLKNKHAYMLENFDEDWVYVNNNRRANYTNLNPGEYLFKVKVANSDGVWSKEVSQLRVIVEPPLWATWWFRTITILLILLLVYAYIISRVNRVKTQKLLLELQVRERTHEVIKQKEEIEIQKELLELEKEKADQLLYNILPEEIAIELKNKGKATARQYRLASIMFTDFKSFTKIAEKITPQELVAELDYYFVNFDAIIEKYHIEKIKTIGDAYMCAGGIPLRNKSNPIDIVLAGLEIQRFVDNQNPEREAIGKQPWGLRIGIHTGEITAGVIGSKRFAYDIWGDSVNIGSRMEEAGEVGKVNISGATYEHIKEFFVSEYRGKIKAKNKGLIDMYFVTKIREELSINGEGIVPNELFKKYVDLHIYSGINYRKAEKYILKRLEKELPNNLHYHDINHTRDVCAAVERLALMEGIEGDDIFLLKTAALYHDSGFIKQYAKNEDIGAALAQEVLPQFGYSQKQIDRIGQLISVTKIPHQPENHLEEIICDADLDYLGGDSFYQIADKLKLELMERSIVNSDKEWDELQIKFLESHHYFTKTAIQLRQKNKEQRIAEIKKRLTNY